MVEDPKNLYSLALMQKLPYEGFDFAKIKVKYLTLVMRMMMVFWVICDKENTNEYEDRRRNLKTISLIERPRIMS